LLKDWKWRKSGGEHIGESRLGDITGFGLQAGEIFMISFASSRFLLDLTKNPVIGGLKYGAPLATLFITIFHHQDVA
jgi:hypothetical protein